MSSSSISYSAETLNTTLNCLWQNDGLEWFLSNETLPECLDMWDPLPSLPNGSDVERRSAIFLELQKMSGGCSEMRNFLEALLAYVHANDDRFN